MPYSTVEQFDVAISNPPYQEHRQGTSSFSLYPSFLRRSSLISTRSAMIHPVRAFQGTGRMKNRDDVNAILADPHYTIETVFDDATTIFPHTDIRGGVMITLHDTYDTFPNGFDILRPHALVSIQHKVAQRDEVSIMKNIYMFKDNVILDTAHHVNPAYFQHSSTPKHFVTSIFHKAPELFTTEHASDTIPVLGRDRDRIIRAVPKDFVQVHPAWRNKWKVFLPLSHGGEGHKIGTPYIGGPDMIASQTFMAFGMFTTRSEAVHCATYLQTRFARALLSILKVTQHNAKRSWQYVPTQDFTAESDIDWAQPIDAIDAQLYAKYGLTSDEIAWIEQHVHRM